MRQPIKRKQKNTKQQSQPIDSTNNLNIYLTKDAEPSMQLQGLYTGPTNYEEQYGEVPQIDQSLPVDHPKNIRAAIAQKQGWVEVPIKYIDIDVNKRWENKIRQTAAKYGPDAKYIVNPKTREIIPESTFKQMQTDLAFQNTSGQIQDQNTQFEVQQAQNHRNLQRRDPQGLAYITLAAGALTNPLTATALGYLGQADYLYHGYNDAYKLFQQGDYGQGLLKAGTTSALGLIPYGKMLSYLRYAPKVGIPALAALSAADAYASNTEPHEFVSTLSPEDKALVDNENTDWETIGNNEAERERLSAALEKELTAGHFKYHTGKDTFGQNAKVVVGNKGEGVEEEEEEEKTKWYKDPWFWGPPVAIETIPPLAKWLFKVKIPWPKVARILGWSGYLYGRAAYDEGMWPFQNTGTEENPDGYDEELARYYQKLVTAYLRLNSGKYNGYANGSTFSPYQSYPKQHNYDWRVGAEFDKPDTNAIIAPLGRLVDTTGVAPDRSNDSLTNIISDIKVPTNGQ